MHLYISKLAAVALRPRNRIVRPDVGRGRLLLLYRHHIIRRILPGGPTHDDALALQRVWVYLLRPLWRLFCIARVSDEVLNAAARAVVLAREVLNQLLSVVLRKL